MEIKVVKNILAANESIAEENSLKFRENKVFVINLMGSPGSGKTSVIEQTIEKLKSKLSIAVIEGDISTTRDADRLAKFGVPIVQINTEPFGGACHLDANMIRTAIASLELDRIEMLVIENVGNLVCPAEFEVGESKRVMVLSVTEGEDKPLKYPLMFRTSDAILINKLDLLDYLALDMAQLLRNIAQVNPSLVPMKISAKTGYGLKDWLHWLLQEEQGKRIKEKG